MKISPLSFHTVSFKQQKPKTNTELKEAKRESYKKIYSTIEKGLIYPTSVLYNERIQKNIIKKFNQCDVESSNVEMLLDLVDEGLLPSHVLQNIDKTNKVSKNVADDLDKLYEGKTEQKSIKETFVPDFKTKQEALSSIKIGDVCKIGDDKNISIKTNDDEIEELFISPDAYLRLFPPVEKFICVQSFNFGDCYFIATMDAINQNPNTRHILLKMFKENQDGTIDASLSGFKKQGDEISPYLPYKPVLCDIEKEVDKEISKEKRRTSYTTKGLMALELLNIQSHTMSAQNNIKKQYDKFKELKQCAINDERIQDEITQMQYDAGILDDLDISLLKFELEDNNSVFYDDKKYTTEELDYFISYLENHSTEDVIHSKSIKDDIVLNEETINEKLKELEGKNDDLSNYKKLFLERYKKETEKRGNVCVYNECLPKEFYKDLFDITNTQYGFGGYPIDVLKELCFYTTTQDRPEHPSIKNKLFSDDKDWVFLASTPSSTVKKPPIYPNHAYNIEPIKIDNETKFILRNPHNSLNETIISYDDICKTFSNITCARN